MTRTEVIQRVRAYVDDNFLYARGSAYIDDDAALLALGVIDSLGVMELLMFLEQAFGIVAADDEITEANLGSFSGIADFVIAKTALVTAATIDASHVAEHRAS